jgi:hypothetical protein
MIIQTAPAGHPRLAVMMHEHTALSGQFARAFGNAEFEPARPSELMAYAASHHDAGWAEFDRDPITDEATGLPYNLVDTPVKYITVTSRGSPDFNERQHPYCGLISSMHSWGLYNGRYGISNQVLIEQFSDQERPLVQRMLDHELERQNNLKAELAKNSETARWIEEKPLFQNYKQFQFFDLLALYFNRIHPSERAEQSFSHVPFDAERDTSITIRPRGAAVYALSPFPFAIAGAEFAFAGRLIEARQQEAGGGWPAVLRQSPTRWESFRLVAA